ncbi:hypothetical protein Bpfe_022609 [Biomphalaria pfeifferi]|uniref:Uncharacterized protein n=1 Tax=Biomphalaria pfeifferi TaxID=112525 RepID=A0AAD8B5N5_BIOPF|nr:hypothetical protein Bpfe_022609 [Biomphalaria pfeifferi]
MYGNDAMAAVVSTMFVLLTMQTYIYVIECKAKVCRTAVENFTFDYHDDCYFVGQTKMKFSETRHYCDKFEGALADFVKGLLDFLRKIIRSVSQEIEDYWIVEHEKNSSLSTCTSINRSSFKMNNFKSCESLLVPICKFATSYHDVDGCFIACDKLVAKHSQTPFTSTLSAEVNNTVAFFNSTSSSQTSSDLEESCECDHDVTESNKVYEIVAILMGLSFFISIVINLLLALQIVCKFKKVKNFTSQEEKIVSFTKDFLQNELTSGENYEEMTYDSDHLKSKQGQRSGTNVEDYGTYSALSDEAQTEHDTKREHQVPDTQPVGLNSDRPTYQAITYAALDHRGAQFCTSE